ncbi:MAG: HD domain-containing protein [Planctomycetes bacterium]|nr:HD domain-containing protein [Planctomycetota bacterium]
MTDQQLQKFKAWFADYIADFYGTSAYIDANLELKEIHTDYVCKEAIYIAGAIGLGENDRLIAAVIALFHDVGRFEQFTKYQTYSDAKSENHNLMAVRILKEYNILADLTETEQDIILKAIELHGAKELPADLDELTELHARIIRDADKLDIYRVLTEKYRQYRDDPENYSLELEQVDEPTYSPHIIEAIQNHAQVDYTSLKTLNDMKLLLLAMIFDVNFAPTLKRIKQHGYVGQLLQLLPDDEVMEKVGQTMRVYMENKIFQLDKQAGS